MKGALLFAWILLLGSGSLVHALNDSLWEVERNQYEYPELKEAPQKNKSSASENPLNEQSMRPDLTSFYRIAVFVLIALFLTFLLYVGFKRLNKHKSRQEKSNPLAWSRLEELNPHEPDLEALLKLATSESDQLSIIRLQFLKLIKSLHSNHIIHWDASKTNSLLAVEIKDRGLKTTFLQMLGIYQSHWYGKRQPSEMDRVRWVELYEQSMQMMNNHA